MANQKLSELTAETDFDHDDLLYLVRGGNSRKIVGADFRRSMYDPRYSTTLFEDWLLTLTTSAANRVFDVWQLNFGINSAQLTFPTANGSIGAGQFASSSTTGYCYLTLFDSVLVGTARPCFIPGSLPILCEWRIRFSVVPTASDPAYYCRVGMRSIPDYTQDTSSCHGVWAELYWNGSAQVWKLVAETAGSKTSTDGSAGITANTWHRITVAYTTSNAYMFLDGTQIATLNTGLPTSGAAPFFLTRKTAGNTQILADVDYVWVHQLLSNGR